MTRQALAPRRNSVNFSLPFQGEHYDVTVGYYDDGRPGEVFINRRMTRTSAKVGTLLDGVCRDSAILLSLFLQHGGDLLTALHAVTRDEDGEPSTIVGAVLDRLQRDQPPPPPPQPVTPPDAPVKPAGHLEVVP